MACFCVTHPKHGTPVSVETVAQEGETGERRCGLAAGPAALAPALAPVQQGRVLRGCGFSKGPQNGRAQKHTLPLSFALPLA